MGVISPQCREASIKARKGKTGPNNKGGRIIEKRTGYVWLWMPDHPNANIGRTKAYVAEHRYVMSKMLGRPLKKNENVHHKNGKRDDNRPENLELWVKVQPAGQRAEDLVAFAKQILTEYGELYA